MYRLHSVSHLPIEWVVRSPHIYTICNVYTTPMRFVCFAHQFDSYSTVNTKENNKNINQIHLQWIHTHAKNGDDRRRPNRPHLDLNKQQTHLNCFQFCVLCVQMSHRSRGRASQLFYSFSNSATQLCLRTEGAARQQQSTQLRARAMTTRG